MIQYHHVDTKPEVVEYKTCLQCSDKKELASFIANRNRCKDCNNSNRRQKYQTDDVHRRTLITQATVFKRKIVVEKQRLNKLEQESLGENNQACRYCFEIKSKERFRHNRRKCRDCERDDPAERFKRCVRTRIYACLKHLKSKSSIDYLGCSTKEYLSWIMHYNADFTLDNYGPVWHIDHVIPLSKFDITNKTEQLLAFNWRNTMPLSAVENRRKNNKIIPSQLSEHFQKVKQYHIKNNLVLPNNYIELCATHLGAGNPLEPTTTTL